MNLFFKHIQKNIVALLCFSILLFSCKKHNAPTTGIVMGMITPVDGGSTVTILSSSGGAGFTNPFQPSGEYEFTNVLAGSYNLSIVTKPGWNTPSPLLISVVAGQTTTVPTILITKTPTMILADTVSFTLNGTQYDYYGSHSGCSYKAPNFYMLSAPPTNPYYEIAISLDNVYSANNFIIAGTKTNFFELFYYITPGNSQGYWAANPSSAVCNITQIDLTDSVISGNFQGTLYPQGATVGNMNINGRFVNLKITN